MRGHLRRIHALDALFGVSFERYKAGDFSATGVDFPMDKILNNLSSATTPYDVSGNSSGNGLISVFGRFNYQLMEKYLFTFTARFDGSSKLLVCTRNTVFSPRGLLRKIVRNLS